MVPLWAGQLAGAPADRVPNLPALLVFEPLSDSELRVLRYLPANLTAPEIARRIACLP